MKFFKEKKLAIFEIVFVVLSALTILFLLLGVSTHHYVSYGKKYSSKNYVAAYLYKYNELPVNFIEKNEWNSDYKLLKSGKNVGGDNFEYRGSIVDYTQNTNLREADLYKSRLEVYKSQSRGTIRLVYAYSDSNVVEIFYTEDHYETFSKITKFNVNLFSNISYIIMGSLLLIQVVIVVVNLVKDEQARSFGYFRQIGIFYLEGFICLIGFIPGSIYYIVLKVQNLFSKRVKLKQ